MAEAAVEDRPQGTPRFFCHKCNVELFSVSPVRRKFFIIFDTICFIKKKKKT